MMRRKYILLIAGLLISLRGFTQDDVEQEGEVESAEIVIEKDRQISLKKEQKLYELIKWQPEKSEYKLSSPNFSSFEYNLSMAPIAFEPPQLDQQEKEVNYYQHVKAGFGNFGSPLIDVSLSTPNNVNKMAGLNFKHLSFSKGAVDGKNSATSMTEATLYGLIVLDGIKIKPSFTYGFDKNYFYGYPEGTAVDRDSVKRGNQYLDLGVELYDNDATDKWYYGFDVRMKNYSDNYENKENALDVDGSVGFSDMVYIDGELKLLKYDDVVGSSRSYYRFQPYYMLSLGDLSANIGVSISGQSDDLPGLSNNKIFPYLNASYQLDDSYELFAKLDAGFNPNTMYSLSSNMPYLNPIFGVVNTQKDVDLSAGVKGNISTDFSVQVKLGFQSLKYLPIFVNNGFTQGLIDVHYDSSSIRVFDLGLSARYYLNTNNNIGLSMAYYNYSSGSLGAVYHRPTVEVKLKGDHVLIEKLSLQWQFALLSGIKAYESNTDSDLTLSAITKLDLAAHYLISEQFGAFVSFDNIMSQNYSNYLYYLQKGIMFKVGATYRF